MRIWNGIRWRQATKDGDAAIILASLLYGKTSGFWLDNDEDADSFKMILRAPPEDRWATLFRTRTTWPQGIIFVKCKTIPEKGLRWAPNEVGTYGRDIGDPLPGKVTPRGIIITRPGYMFLNLGVRMDYEFEFHDVARNDWYSVVPMDKDDIAMWPDPKDGIFVLVQSKRGAGFAQVPAIVARIEVPDGPDIIDNVVYVEFACKVYVSKVFDERKREIEAELGPNPDLPKMSGYVKASRYEEDDKWCIG